ncbi:MAG TPA: ATP-binding cassette domain-containing protein [Clostridiales bacterium]|jgi:putative ABC transport system ATP-binding protein|nr:ATP-binding cassette domain-containing protein [Clostridiales bacterium]
MATQINCDTGFVGLRHIKKTFNPGSVNEVVLFTDFNLEIPKNQFVAVVGSNGSGKTTMLNLLCGSVPADSGEITIGGRDIMRLKEHQRSKFIGRVFQDPSKGTCPELTILENMALADNKGLSYGLSRGVNKKRVDYYRSRLELLRLGLEDKIHLPVASLSGGQRQALALLICTMTPLDLLILDEHTAALDPRSSETVMELTDRLVKEKNLTTLMVTHNLKYAIGYGDRLIMLHRGGIVLDVSGENKSALHTKDLTDKFNEISIEDGN